MDDLNKFSHDLEENNEQKSEKTPLWKKVGVFFAALIMAFVTVFVMNLKEPEKKKSGDQSSVSVVAQL